MCKTFRCLPSQLNKEDAKTIQKFIEIENEVRLQQRDEILKRQAEARLRSGKF